MSSNFIISTKSSGLCFNIMRVLILTAISYQLNRTLIFLTKENHIPILKAFSRRTTFIPYREDHTKIFNNYTRNKSIYSVYDLKYKQFIKDNYVNAPIDDMDLIVGNMDDVLDHKTDKKYLLVDYNDGLKDNSTIHKVKIPPIPVKKDELYYDTDATTINIKINDPNNRRIYEFWDEIIPKIKKKNNKVILVSGNNDIKKYLCKKHNCIYFQTGTETEYSNVRGNDIIRGKPEAIMKDVMLCATTNFIAFNDLKAKFPQIVNAYPDLNFTVEKEEKFDILVKYLSKNITIVES